MPPKIALVILAAGLLVAGCAAPAGPATPSAPAATDMPSPITPVSSTSSPTMTEQATVEAAEPPTAISPLRLLAAHAIEDLALRLGIPTESVEVVFAAEVEWPDASVGCPAPGFSYAQVLTDGMKVTLQVGKTTYDYHGRSPDGLFLCGANGPVPPGVIP